MQKNGCKATGEIINDYEAIVKKAYKLADENTNDGSKNFKSKGDVVQFHIMNMLEIYANENSYNIER